MSYQFLLIAVTKHIVKDPGDIYSNEDHFDNNKNKDISSHVNNPHPRYFHFNKLFPLLIKTPSKTPPPLTKSPRIRCKNFYYI